MKHTNWILTGKKAPAAAEIILWMAGEGWELRATSLTGTRVCTQRPCKEHAKFKCSAMTSLS